MLDWIVDLWRPVALSPRVSQDKPCIIYLDFFISPSGWGCCWCDLSGGECWTEVYSLGRRAWGNVRNSTIQRLLIPTGSWDFFEHWFNFLSIFFTKALAAIRPWNLMKTGFQETKLSLYPLSKSVLWYMGAAQRLWEIYLVIDRLHHMAFQLSAFRYE